MERDLALVIGAGGPVGNAALSALGSSHRLLATSRRGAEGLTEIDGSIQRAELDACDDASWKGFVEALPATPRVVIHCVGDFAIQAIDSQQPSDFEALVQSNLFTAFKCYYHLAPLLRSQAPSALIFFGLAHGQMVKAEPRVAAYYAAKQALSSLVKSIAAQEAPRGLACSLIALGFIEGSPRPSSTDAAAIPRTQLVEAIQQLTGPLAQQLSGSLLDLSGGWRLR